LKANIWPQFTDPGHPFYDQDSQYTVPYVIYSTGIGYQHGMIDEKDWPDNLANPFDAFWNPALKGKVNVYDDYREALSMPLLRNGVEDINTGDPAALEAAREALLDLAQTNNMALTINGTYEDLPKGIFAIAQAWSGDIIAAPWYGKGSFKETAALLSYWWPKDRTGTMGSDTMTILKSSKSPVLAHQFLNHMLDFDNAMTNMSWVGYQPPQLEAPPEAFGDPSFKYASIVPDNLLNCVALPEDFDTGKMLLELPPEVDAMWHDNWEQVTAGV
jgi:spermidine/putrescine transport system substrate-binding protein